MSQDLGVRVPPRPRGVSKLICLRGESKGFLLLNKMKSKITWLCNSRVSFLAHLDNRTLICYTTRVKSFLAVLLHNVFLFPGFLAGQ